ncbi:unnamed protein product [Thelazia callipaeda]|uniref:Methyltransferase-like protein 21D n=1 Tax=Thelazia callipaeda TaxID=103827 RepID=A0A0N5D1D2_THECL|nr:unnamed protein product [Thelazia callipaeda]
MTKSLVCDTSGDENASHFIRKFNLSSNEVIINQECIGDVGCIVWDSAIVACYYFARKQSFWRGKKILEIGAGTGVCSIVLGVLGANVVATDLSDRIGLIHQNIANNLEAIVLNEGVVKVETLDWNDSCDQLIYYDVVVMIDTIYYLKALDGLLKILLRIKAPTVVCCYEVRDIGEPMIAQQRFFEMISPFFNVALVTDKELDPLYKSSDIKVLTFARR